MGIGMVLVAECATLVLTWSTRVVVAAITLGCWSAWGGGCGWFQPNCPPPGASCAVESRWAKRPPYAEPGPAG